MRYVREAVWQHQHKPYVSVKKGSYLVSMDTLAMMWMNASKIDAVRTVSTPLEALYARVWLTIS